MPWHIDIVEKIRISQGWPNRWKYTVKEAIQRVESRYYNVPLRNIIRLQFTIFRLIVQAVIIAGHLVCTIALVGFHSFISNQISAAAGGAYIAIMKAIHLLIHRVTRGSKTLAWQRVLACATVDVGASFARQASRFIAAFADDVLDERIAADSRVKTQSDKIIADDKQYCIVRKLSYVCIVTLSCIDIALVYFNHSSLKYLNVFEISDQMERLKSEMRTFIVRDQGCHENTNFRFPSKNSQLLNT